MKKGGFHRLEMGIKNPARPYRALNNLLRDEQVGALPQVSRSLLPVSGQAGPGGLQSACGAELPKS